VDVRVEIKYRLELNRDEWLVVSKALREFAGTSPPPNITAGEREIASALQEQMLVQKRNALTQMAADAGKAVANVEEAKSGTIVEAKPARESKR